MTPTPDLPNKAARRYDRKTSLMAALGRRPILAIVAERLGADLFTSTDDEIDQCVYDSGTGRCDGLYNHKGKLHFRVEGDELWESPW